MSYKELSVHLKPCFLYMGVFPEDEAIQITRLIKLWVAEGFLKPVTEKSVEEVAREYLTDLVDRNLVLIDKMGSSGNIKKCKVHDLLRDLCSRESQKQRFYIAKSTTLEGIVNEQRRMVIKALSSMSLARSLLWDRDEKYLPPLSFKLLRTLGSSTFFSPSDADFLSNMNQLVNSRYLAISAHPRDEFPSSIWLYWNLQTLIFGRDDFVLGNLQTLERIVNFKCSEQVVTRIPNIKKLKISYIEGLDDDMYCLSNLDSLGTLEYLTCTFDEVMNPSRPDSLRSLINFPHSLKRLSLRIHESQCWEDILDKIGALPLLQKLKLSSGTFKERHWKTTEGQFRRLKFLSLGQCNGLQFWTAESSHFPCLEHLLLVQVEELEEIPLDFAEISTLRVLNVSFCCNSVVTSAKRILEEQEELYGEEAALQVHVTLPWNSKALESSTSPNFHCRIGLG